MACPTDLQFSIYAGDVAVSMREDKALIFGVSRGRNCGVFEISLPNGVPRLVADIPCSDRPTGPGFSCSPDCAFATFVHHKTLHVLDVAKGTLRPLGTEFLTASWSPDGKWIAGVEWVRRPVTVLFDGASFERRKTLPDSRAEWSADSRYLLGIVGCWNREEGTAAALSIDTGKASVIRSSRCQIYHLGTGWVDKSVIMQAGQAGSWATGDKSGGPTKTSR